MRASERAVHSGNYTLADEIGRTSRFFFYQSKGPGRTVYRNVLRTRGETMAAVGGRKIKNNNSNVRYESVIVLPHVLVYMQTKRVYGLVGYYLYLQTSIREQTTRALAVC